MNIWSTTIIKTRSFDKRNAHTSDYKCISWAKHSNRYDDLQNELESKVSYLKSFFSFHHWSEATSIIWQRRSRKNRDTARKVLSLIFSSECQRHRRIIHISDSLIQFTHHRRWSEADNQTSKSRQSVECFRYFKQSASSESCRTDLSTDKFIQRMRNTQVSFKAV